MKKKLKARYIIAIVLIVLVGLFLNFIRAEKAMPEALNLIISDAEMQATETRDSITFSPNIEKKDTALVIYPGAKVDPKAYTPMAKAMAYQGIDVIIVKMPLNMAILSPNKADKIIAEHPNIKHWYIAGHSLGGVMAARYAKKHQDTISGLILWASYPEKSTDLSQSTMPVMSIYGTNDGLAQPGTISDTMYLLPKTVQWVSIKGGNHSQFGWYGFQKGDNPADISREEQQKEIVESTMELIKLNAWQNIKTGN